MGKLNLFELARVELTRENKEVTEAGILAYAVKIRKFCDKHNKMVDKILADKVTKDDLYNWKKRYNIAVK